jgi:DNA-binding XRE family transcriptional regulator
MSYRGMTQKDLTQKTGMFKQTINDIFSGKVMPFLESINKIAEVLNISASDLWEFPSHFNRNEFEKYIRFVELNKTYGLKLKSGLRCQLPDLGKIVNLHTISILSFEKGNLFPSFTVVKKLSEIFNLNIEELFLSNE